MKSVLSIFVIALAFACSAPEANNQLDVDSVLTKAGLISGKLVGPDSIKAFMGIPFAAPPLGELRWKKPQQVETWKDVKVCTENPASAIQNPPVAFFAWSEEFLIPIEPISEDCLYLNVWTGADKSDEKRPVIVWVHGGGFSGGSGTVPLYDGEEMARKGIVFVTINYRLGVFGFLAHPELTKESSDSTSGNYGILDQIAALEWVKSNIANFGGDPNNVTLAGQSAGAFSVNALVASALTKGLIHKAIAQSGGMFKSGSGRPSTTLEMAETSGKTYTEQAGATTIAQLRTMPADSLLKIRGAFWPIIDGKVIPSIDEVFASKKYNDVPLLTGWNADDNVSFGPPVSPSQFTENAKKQYGEAANEYLTLFPASDSIELKSTQDMLGELMFGFQNYTWAKNQKLYGQHPAYVYYFTRVPPGEPDYGAFHSAEFGYALHTLKFWKRPFTQDDFQLEQTMSDYWVNFAKSGNPNGEGLPEWPIFDPENPRVMELGVPVQTREIPHLQQLRFLEKMNQK